MSDNYEHLSTLMKNDIYKFEKLFFYDGSLGVNYSKNSSKFIIWAPLASKVFLLLYGKDGKDLKHKEYEIIKMNPGQNGIFEVKINRDLNLQYYNYLIVNGDVIQEVVDPYAKSVSVNGLRSQVVDLNETNPKGWSNDRRPDFISFQGSSIYEIHIRDFSIDANSGVSIKNKGKFLGFSEKSTNITGSNTKTCLEHLKELGITHVHLLPVYDFASIDESKENQNTYNWGYDPQNYNALEGSYSLDPFNGEVRIKEFKTMVKTLHDNGIRVILDVVYNHTFETERSNLNKIVPNYYYRQNEFGGFSNGSGCGNEIASERKMVRKFILDSIKYWTDEFHIDGFRLDLMGLYDLETIDTIREELDKIDSSIILYGEGWTGGDTVLEYNNRGIKNNINKFLNKQIAVFSDDIRDGIKGSTFYRCAKGFVSGGEGLEETIKFGVVASTYHKDVDINKVNYSNSFWANEPYQTINYVSSHDNLTLFDKLNLSNKGESDANIILMNKLAATIIFTSQGIPFIQGGEEILRTKCDINGNIIENSYNASDYVNRIDWARKIEFNEVFLCYKNLIEIRKEHPAFRMESSKLIQENLYFLKKGNDFKSDKVVSFRINGNKVNDTYKDIIVIYNANKESIDITLPDGKWSVVYSSYNNIINSDNCIFEGNFNAQKICGYILVKFS
ncbi:pullulanase, type I [Clostridium baratii str. Sullivan]|uniref:Pullulanase, type I n=1 Tax=Clostridium baratii str. Sullivan TaxID=1415775 RepID=A0A0A7FXQ8_9CLOT|nr:type I pullulanase [Clostridium baratii]AIY84424.1 pullulanase, type I [Clostridium baratii str. Sullivan]